MRNRIHFFAFLLISLFLSVGLAGQGKGGPLQNPEPPDDDKNLLILPGTCPTINPYIPENLNLLVHNITDGTKIYLAPGMPALRLAIYKVPEFADAKNINELDRLFLSQAYNLFQNTNTDCLAEFMEGPVTGQSMNIYSRTVSIPTEQIIQEITQCKLSEAGEDLSIQLVYALVHLDSKNKVHLYPTYKYPNFFSCLIPDLNDNTGWITEASFLDKTCFVCDPNDAGDEDPLISNTDNFNSMYSSDQVINSVRSSDVNLINAKIYPVPFSQFLNIKYSKETSIEILDSRGRSILNTSVQSSTLNTSEWKEGIYFIRSKSVVAPYRKSRPQLTNNNAIV